MGAGKRRFKQRRLILSYYRPGIAYNHHRHQVIWWCSNTYEIKVWLAFIELTILKSLFLPVKF